MIGLFSVFKVVEPQVNYMEKLYDWVSTNLNRCFVATFPALHIYFIYIKHAYFATLMKYILELLELSFVKTCVD
jgi:hypothetical protein